MRLPATHERFTVSLTVVMEPALAARARAALVDEVRGINDDGTVWDDGGHDLATHGDIDPGAAPLAVLVAWLVNRQSLPLSTIAGLVTDDESERSALLMFATHHEGPRP